MITKFKSSKYSITKPKTTFERMQTHFKLAPTKKNGCVAVAVPAPSANISTMASQTQANIIMNQGNHTDPAVEELYARIINTSTNTPRPGTESAVDELYARIVAPTSSNNNNNNSARQNDPATEELYAKLTGYSFKPINSAQETAQPQPQQQYVHTANVQQLRQSPSPSLTPAPAVSPVPSLSPQPLPQNMYNTTTQLQYAQMYQQQQQQHHQQHKQQHQHQPTAHRQSPSAAPVYQFPAPAVPNPSQFDMGANEVKYSFPPKPQQQPQQQPQPQPQGQPQGQPQPIMYQFGGNHYFTPMPGTAFAISSSVSPSKGEFVNNGSQNAMQATSMSSLPGSMPSSVPHSVFPSHATMNANTANPSSTYTQQQNPLLDNGLSYGAPVDLSYATPSSTITALPMHRNNSGYFMPSFTSTELMNELFAPNMLPPSPSPAVELFNLGNVNSPCAPLEVINLPTTTTPQASQVSVNQNTEKPAPTIMMALQAHSSKLCQSSTATTTTTTTSTAPVDTPSISTVQPTTKFDPFYYNQNDNLGALFDLPEYECALFAQRRPSKDCFHIPSSSIPSPCQNNFEDDTIPDVLDELKEYLRKREREEPGTTSITDDEANFFARKRRKSVCNEQIGQYLLGNPLFNDIVAPFDPSLL